MELGVLGSWVSIIAASAVSALALEFAFAIFSFSLSLALWRGRVEGATCLEVASALVMVRAPNLFGRVASRSAIVRAMGRDMAGFTTGIAGLGCSWR
jgi:hypothetical protein